MLIWSKILFLGEPGAKKELSKFDFAVVDNAEGGHCTTHLECVKLLILEYDNETRSLGDYSNH